MRKSSALVDTGILYALADKGDSWHRRAADSVNGFRGPLIVPSSVIPEVCYLLNSCLGPFAETAFLASLNNREMSVEQVSASDVARSVEILKQYTDANIGFVDASMVAMAERLRIDAIMTTDRRHFSLIKPAHCSVFKLLP